MLERLRDVVSDHGERERLREGSRSAFKHLAEATREEGLYGVEGAAQSDLFSLTELCAFLIGADFNALEGRCRLAERLFPQDADKGCIVVGTGGVDQNVRWSSAVARGEFDERMKAGQIDLAFEWIQNACSTAGTTR